MTYYFILLYGLVDYILFDRRMSKEMKNELTISKKQIILDKEATDLKTSMEEDTKASSEEDEE